MQTPEEVKAQLKRRGALVSQQAIVSELERQDRKNGKVHFTIPAGKTMMTDLTDMVEAANTWLRRVRNFNSVSMSMARNPSKYKPNRSQFEDFDQTSKSPEWEGRSTMWLAEKLGQILKSAGEDFLGFEVNRSGIQILTSTQGEIAEEDLEPHLVFMTKSLR